MQKKGKNHTLFHRCAQHPKCDFSSWDLPLKETCPNCGKMLFRKKGKNYIYCADKACGYKKEVPAGTAEETDGQSHE